MSHKTTILTKVNEGILVITVLLMNIKSSAMWCHITASVVTDISKIMMCLSSESSSPKRANAWSWKWRLYDPPSSQHLGPQCLQLQGQKTLAVWLWKRRLYNHSEWEDLLTQPYSTTFHMTWIFTLVSHLKSAYITVFSNHEYCHHSVHHLWRYLLNAILFWKTHHAFCVSSTKIWATIMFEGKGLVWCYTVLLSE